MFSVAMDQKGEWLRKALKSSFHFNKWRGVKTEPMTGMRGYMSDMTRVYPHWEGDHLPESFIVKLPVFSSLAGEALQDEAAASTEENDSLVRIFHRTESKMYQLFAQLDSPPVPMPRVYLNRIWNGINNDDFSVLVMEDLGRFTTVDLVVGFNDKQLYAIADAIADLYVYAFTNTGWEAVGFTPDETDMMTMAPLVDKLSVRLAKISPQHFVRLGELQELIGNEDWNIAYHNRCNQGEILSTLCHGDMWAANLMWQGDTLKAIIDWQISHKGSILEDLMHVLITCTTVETRKRLTKPILSYYFHQLNSKMNRIGQSLPFTLDDVHKCYRQTLSYASMKAVFAVAFWSNSFVLKDSTDPDNENKRISEIYDRARSIIEEAILSLRH